MSGVPAAGARGRREDDRRELRTIDSRTTILTNRPNDRYLVQIGRRIPASEGVEKRSLRAVKVELEEVDGA
jgi:hypothetical protein